MRRSTLPPRFVPTLTEVVQPLDVPGQTTVADNSDDAVALAAGLQEQMVLRVLQRVDLLIERRLREAVGQLILEHADTLAPRLREEIEQVVRQSVSQAFDQEVVQSRNRS